MEAPYKPDISADTIDVKFFNAKGSAQDLTETFIPETKIKKVERAKDQFKDFNST